MNALNQEPQVKAELERLIALLAEHESIQAFKEIETKVKNNQNLQKLEEKIKQAQKDAVNFAHYGKPEAEKQAIAEIEQATAEYDEHPLVIAYREKLLEANDLLHFVTDSIQKQINEAIEEEGSNASKD